MLLIVRGLVYRGFQFKNLIQTKAFGVFFNIMVSSNFNLSVIRLLLVECHNRNVQAGLVAAESECVIHHPQQLLHGV
jgi:hypothetical protein